jgi:hypothetical protein
VADPLVLSALSGSYAVARLDPAEPVPEWAYDRTLSALVLTEQELTVVCPAAAVPHGVPSFGPLSALAVEGPLDFAQTGILSALAQPLAAAGISIFTLSTFDTDLLLVREEHLDRACDVLGSAGHVIGR